MSTEVSPQALVEHALATTLADDCVVIVEGARIAAIVPRAEVPPGIPVEALPSGMWLAPGFIDCQVNGGGDVLFNDAPTSQTIDRIAAAHLRLGTTSLLPTLILSGFIFPITSMPRALQIITHVVPARYFLIALRGIVLKGAPVATLAGPLTALAVYAAVMLSLSSLRLARERG